MADKKKIKVQSINDFVVNPITGKLIKVHSTKYRQLIKDSILKVEYKTRKDNIVYDGEDPKKVIKNLKTDEKSHLAIKKGKVIKERKRLQSKDYIEKTIDNAYDLIKNDLNDIDVDNMDDDELYNCIRRKMHEKNLTQI